MRSFFPVLCFLALCRSSAAAAAPGKVVSFPVCVVTAARPAPAHEPPAWLLLGGAVLLLGAGRLAARQAA